MTNTEKCERCKRDAPPVDGDEFIYWEALSSGGLICPGCVTLGEQQATDDDAMNMTALSPDDYERTQDTN